MVEEIETDGNLIEFEEPKGNKDRRVCFSNSTKLIRGRKNEYNVKSITYRYE